MKKTFLLFATFLVSTLAFGQAENGFSFQGYARNAEGVPLKNLSELEVKFQLYVESVRKFEEIQTLTTNEFGTFQTTIGKVQTSSFAGLDFLSYGYTLKVYIKDNGAWVMVANKPLMAVPYAMAAKKAEEATTAKKADDATSAKHANTATTADKVQDGSNGVPVGTIVPFAGKTNKVPSGWFLCDGSYKSTSTYSALYNVIGFNWGKYNSSNFRVPDLRGVFLRGVNHSASSTYSDPYSSSSYRKAKYSYGNTGNMVGSYQDDDNLSHNHTMNSAGKHNHKSTTDGQRNFPNYGFVYDDNTWTTQGTDNDHGSSQEEINLGYFIQAVDAGSHTHSINTKGSQARPVNAYVNYIIKY